jgi:hypothetical protein
MNPGFMSGLARMGSHGVAKDVYPSLMGSLQYAVVRTHFDVSTALSILGFAHENPAEAHLHALPKVVRSLHGTIDLRMTLEGGVDYNLQLTSFADTDWANDNTRKSRSDYLLTLGRGHVRYKTKQQTCVPMFTCEAEYYSSPLATKEGLIHLRHLMGEIFNNSINKTTTMCRTAKAPSLTLRMPWSKKRSSMIFT